jgi:hypothetical protein
MACPILISNSYYSTAASILPPPFDWSIDRAISQKALNELYRTGLTNGFLSAVNVRVSRDEENVWSFDTEKRR